MATDLIDNNSKNHEGKDQTLRIEIASSVIDPATVNSGQKKLVTVNNSKIENALIDLMSKQDTISQLLIMSENASCNLSDDARRGLGLILKDFYNEIGNVLELYYQDKLV